MQLLQHEFNSSFQDAGVRPQLTYFHCHLTFCWHCCSRIPHEDDRFAEWCGLQKYISTC